MFSNRLIISIVVILAIFSPVIYRNGYFSLFLVLTFNQLNLIRDENWGFLVEILLIIFENYQRFTLNFL